MFSKLQGFSGHSWSCMNTLQPSSYDHSFGLPNQHHHSLFFIFSDLTDWMLLLDLGKLIEFNWYTYPSVFFFLGSQLHSWLSAFSLRPSSYWSTLPWPICFQQALPFSLLYFTLISLTGCESSFLHQPDLGKSIKWSVNFMCIFLNIALLIIIFLLIYSVVDWFSCQGNGNWNFDLSTIHFDSVGKLIIIANNCPPLRKSEIEYYAMLAKVGVHHFNGSKYCIFLSFHPSGTIEVLSGLCLLGPVCFH